MTVLPKNNNDDHIDIMESISDNYISKISGVIYENNNESDDQEESKAGIEFEFVLLSSNKKYPQIFNIKSQTKNIETASLMTITIINSIMKAVERMQNSENNKEVPIEPNNYLIIQRPAAHVFDNLKLRIIQEFYWEKNSRSWISEKLMLSYSSVCRIIREYEANAKEFDKMFERRQVNLNWCPAAKSAIRQFVQNESGWFNSKSVWWFVQNTTGLHLSRVSIRKYMKDRLNLSFKRVSPRPVVQDQARINIYKLIFWVEFVNLIKREHVIVNIDEVLLSNSTKTNYSWGVRGRTAIVKNILFKGSQGLIGSITSRGGWFFSRLHSNNNSDIFIDYVQHLIAWLTDDQNIDIRKVVLLMDNSPIHSSKKTLKYLNELGWKIVFSLPYSLFTLVPPPSPRGV